MSISANGMSLTVAKPVAEDAGASAHREAAPERLRPKQERVCAIQHRIRHVCRLGPRGPGAHVHRVHNARHDHRLACKQQRYGLVRIQKDAPGGSLEC